MTLDARLLAIDWGTSSARAYWLDAQGRVLAERSAPLGIAQIADGNFAGAFATLCGDVPATLPIVACGMIGSRQGWVEAPYQHCPVSFLSLAANLTAAPNARMMIVPGLLCRNEQGVPDVMRGEETQIIGSLSSLRAARESRQIVVLPGTHSKWAIVGDAGIETFATFMTGELYAVLREHSILGRLVPAGGLESDADDDAFDRGVRHSLESKAGLAHDLFSARTLGLTGQLASAAIGDYLSGLLIGAEILGARAWLAEQKTSTARLHLVGAATLTGKYQRALRMAQFETETGPEDAAARGLWRIAGEARIIG